MTALARDFPSFLVSLKATGSRTALSPERLAEELEVPIQKLASLARVHRNTVSFAPASPKLQEAMVDVVRVLSAAHALTGDIDRALFWFRNQPIADFDHFTPMQLVEQGKVQAVIDYIESISAGPAG
ncbi:MAG: DUF2384 domain-containing protein [Xanthomonadales bacterium]|nr:DUF2384 domain-containing protein [Xanthomonadales bacterium]